jgi:carbamoylphosphate synthase small subunit
MLAGSLKSIDLTRTQIDNRITKYNALLNVRKQALFNQYLGYQSQLTDYGYEGQILDLMLGTTITSSTGSNVNTSG